MAEIIYLPRGSRPGKQPNTVIIRVILQGGESVAQDRAQNWSELKMHPSGVQSMIDKLTGSAGIQAIYVVGFDDKAKDQARNFDQLREYVTRSPVK